MNDQHFEIKRFVGLASAVLLFAAGVGTAKGGEIHGVVWEDVDGHGVVSLRSTVIAGVTIYLDLNENGQLEVFEPSTVTNEYGRYLFADLAPGVYKVTTLAPEGWVQTYPTKGGQLLFVGVVRNIADIPRGMDAVRSLAVSPDGRHLYAAAMFDDAIEVLSRDVQTGKLTVVQVVEDSADGAGGLDGAYCVTVSWDGRHVYAAGAHADAVTAFSRDEDTGELTFVQTLTDGVDGVDGLDSVRAVIVSPDDEHVYTAAPYDDAVGVFRRDQATGTLSFEQVLRDGEGAVDGLYGVCALAASPDGKHVYAAGADDNSLAVFSRDRTTGYLVFAQVLREGDGNVEGLNGVRSVALSPGGGQVYAAGADDDAIVVFSRDETSGELEFVQIVQDGRDGVTGLWGVQSLVVGVNGRYVYATGTYDDSMMVFSRGSATGKLTFKQILRDEVGFVDGLDGAYSLAVTPDGEHVYAAGTYEDAVSAFKLEMIHYVDVDTGQVLLGVDFGIHEEPDDTVCRGGNDGCVDPDDGGGDPTDGSDSPSGSRLCGAGALAFVLPIGMASLVLKAKRRPRRLQRK